MSTQPLGLDVDCIQLRIGVTSNAGENDPTLSASYGWLLPDTPEAPLLGATL